MKVAVVGSRGYIAGFLLSRLHKVTDEDRVVRVGRGTDADAVLRLETPATFD